MRTEFLCHECDRDFRTQAGLEWHAQHVHGTSAGSIVHLSPEWDDVQVTTIESPGRVILVYPSNVDLGASHETVQEQFDEEMAKLATVFDTLRPLLPPLDIDEKG